MNGNKQKVIDGLRDKGYAVIVWTPKELGSANPRKVEDRSVNFGWDVIADLGGPRLEEQSNDKD